MENLVDCKKINFNIVEPGNVYSKKIKINSPFVAKRTTRCGEENPLEHVFYIFEDVSFPLNSNHFVVQYKPSLPFYKSFAVEQIEFEDGSKQFLNIVGETKGSDVRCSNDKIYFKTYPYMSSSHFILRMKNHSDCSDNFCWDYIPQDSEILITPLCGTILGNSSIEVSVTFQPRRRGALYRVLSCLFKFQEPLFVDIFSFHQTSDENLKLDKCIILDEVLPSYPTNYCRYINDCAVKIPPESKPTVSSSTRYINFGQSVVNQGFATTREIFLTNHAEKTLTAKWSSDVCGVIEVTPRCCTLKRNDGIGWFLVKFVPQIADVFYSGELRCSFSWGLHDEYEVPFCITVHAIGNSFSRNELIWEPQHRIGDTRIILPGTVPNVPSYTTFQINNASKTPLQFSIERENIKKRSDFVIKPMQGLITEEFQLIVVQLFPTEGADTFYKEDWVLLLNGVIKENLELCGSCELPFVMVSSNKDVDFPLTSLGTTTSLRIPIKNPTRLELEYQCQECLPVRVFSSERKPTIIGPGEQHYIDVHFQPESVGPEKGSMGIALKWAPRHSVPLKFLGKREITSETVVRFTGEAVTVNVSAHPSELIIRDILLNDWGNDYFSVTNSGCGSIYLRLNCKRKNWFSMELPWKIYPNDLTLRSGECEKVNISVLGIERGFEEFIILCELFKTASFTQSTEISKLLVKCSIFVDYPSLHVEDVRYDGLAKSLSKRFLWDLLQINRLNEILSQLESDKNHYHFMKMPEYIEQAPTFTLEFLLKNTSVFPVRLSVDVRKNCQCPPIKADTLSRRIQVDSCEHEDELTANLQTSIIKPGKSTILTFVAVYNSTDYNLYSVSLKITSDVTSKLKTTLLIDVERGIVSSKARSLNFFLPPADSTGLYQVKFEDVYVGDSSKYIQVIWLYNHSQFDLNYWTEWLMVNHKVFRFIKERGIVESNSCQPLYVMFTPYEMKTYEAKLAIMAEHGVEYFINIEGTGTISHELTTISMLNKMPPSSLFENDPISVELSTDHLCLRPMPTHSFDKYIFFMKNNTNDTIRFTWDILVIWSVMKVIIEPREGELLPGEVFPLQMNVHTYRFPAILNFTVECYYFKKYEAEAHHKKSLDVTKAGVLFDTCFVLVPDKQIDIAYRTPHLGAKSGKPPKNNIISIGGSAHIFNAEFIDIMIPSRSKQLKFLSNPQLNFNLEDKSAILTKTLFARGINILERIMREVVHSNYFKESMTKKRSPIRYIDLPNKEDQIRPNLARRQLGLLLSNVIYSSCLRLFEIDPIVYHDKIEDIEPEDKVEKTIVNIRNAYYEKMLGDERGQMHYFAEMKVKRLKSRDHITRVKGTFDESGNRP